jgi:hypothetical protein
MTRKRRKERTMGRIISKGMATQEKITRMVNFVFINPRQFKRKRQQDEDTEGREQDVPPSSSAKASKNNEKGKNNGKNHI